MKDIEKNLMFLVEETDKLKTSGLDNELVSIPDSDVKIKKGSVRIFEHFAAIYYNNLMGHDLNDMTDVDYAKVYEHISGLIAEKKQTEAKIVEKETNKYTEVLAKNATKVNKIAEYKRSLTTTTARYNKLVAQLDAVRNSAFVDPNWQGKFDEMNIEIKLFINAINKLKRNIITLAEEINNEFYEVINKQIKSIEEEYINSNDDGQLMIMPNGQQTLAYQSEEYNALLELLSYREKLDPTSDIITVKGLVCLNKDNVSTVENLLNKITIFKEHKNEKINAELINKINTELQVIVERRKKVRKASKKAPNGERVLNDDYDEYLNLLNILEIVNKVALSNKWNYKVNNIAYVETKEEQQTLEELIAKTKFFNQNAPVKKTTPRKTVKTSEPKATTKKSTRSRAKTPKLVNPNLNEKEITYIMNKIRELSEKAAGAPQEAIKTIGNYQVLKTDEKEFILMGTLGIILSDARKTKDIVNVAQNIYVATADKDKYMRILVELIELGNRQNKNIKLDLVTLKNVLLNRNISPAYDLPSPELNKKIQEKCQNILLHPEEHEQKMLELDKLIKEVRDLIESRVDFTSNIPKNPATGPYHLDETKEFEKDSASPKHLTSEDLKAYQQSLAESKARIEARLNGILNNPKSTSDTDELQKLINEANALLSAKHERTAVTRSDAPKRLAPEPVRQNIPDSAPKAEPKKVDVTSPRHTIDTSKTETSNDNNIKIAKIEKMLNNITRRMDPNKPFRKTSDGKFVSANDIREYELLKLQLDILKDAIKKPNNLKNVENNLVVNETDYENYLIATNELRTITTSEPTKKADNAKKEKVVKTRLPEKLTWWKENALNIIKNGLNKIRSFFHKSEGKRVDKNSRKALASGASLLEQKKVNSPKLVDTNTLKGIIPDNHVTMNEESVADRVQELHQMINGFIAQASSFEPIELEHRSENTIYDSLTSDHTMSREEKSRQLYYKRRELKAMLENTTDIAKRAKIEREIEDITNLILCSDVPNNIGSMRR